MSDPHSPQGPPQSSFVLGLPHISQTFGEQRTTDRLSNHLPSPPCITANKIWADLATHRTSRKLILVETRTRLCTRIANGYWVRHVILTQKGVIL